MSNEIGIRLKRLRERAGITGRELARRIKTAQSYVSKIETGGLHPNIAYCRRVAKALNLSESDKTSLLNLLTIYKAEHQPLSHKKNALQERQQAISRLEKDSKIIRVFQPMIIPGLLQTPEYMKALFSHYTQNDTTLQETINRRLDRQARLRDDWRQFDFVISANAFFTNICSQQVILDQITRLMVVRDQPNITIGMIPFFTPIPSDAMIPMTGFQIIDENLVIVDTLNGYMAFRHPDEISDYVRSFDQLKLLARTDADPLTSICDLIKLFGQC